MLRRVEFMNAISWRKNWSEILTFIVEFLNTFFFVPSLFWCSGCVWLDVI
jgi:hypothetical protein